MAKRHVEQSAFDGNDQKIASKLNDPKEQWVKRRRNVFPVSSHDSHCLMISSCFFLIPGIYACKVSSYLYFLVSFITTAVSINYWRDAVEGHRRTADLVTAKVSFSIYFISGCLCVRDLHLLMIGIPGCCCIVLCYLMSNRYWDLDSPLWVYFHMAFHLFVALEQYLIIYADLLSSH